jgi:hypothetical protein
VSSLCDYDLPVKGIALMIEVADLLNLLRRLCGRAAELCETTKNRN